MWRLVFWESTWYIKYTHDTRPEQFASFPPVHCIWDVFNPVTMWFAKKVLRWRGHGQLGLHQIFTTTSCISEMLIELLANLGSWHVYCLFFEKLLQMMCAGWGFGVITACVQTFLQLMIAWSLFVSFVIRFTLQQRQACGTFSCSPAAPLSVRLHLSMFHISRCALFISFSFLLPRDLIVLLFFLVYVFLAAAGVAVILLSCLLFLFYHSFFVCFLYHPRPLLFFSVLATKFCPNKICKDD